MAAFMPTYDPVPGTIRPIPMCVGPIMFSSFCNADNSTLESRLPNSHATPQNTPLDAFATSLVNGSRPPLPPGVLGPPLVDQRAPSHDTIEVQTNELRTVMDGLRQLQQENHALRQSQSRSHISQYNTSGEVSLLLILKSDGQLLLHEPVRPRAITSTTT